MATTNNYVVPSVTSATNLRVGSTGDTVKQLQESLKALGYYQGSIDASFGNQTADALRKFQQASGISADAIYGTHSMSALQTALSKLQAQSSTPANTVPATTVAQNATVPTNQQAVTHTTDTGFVYNPETDVAYQEALKQQQRQITEEMAQRGILGSTIEQERLAQAGMSTAAQYEQAAYERYQNEQNLAFQREQFQYEKDRQKLQDELNAKQQEIENAWNRVSALGYVSNKDASILGIPAGTSLSSATTKEESASTAYLTLQKSIDSWYKNNPQLTIEEIIRQALSGQITMEEADNLASGIKITANEFGESVPMPMSLYSSMAMKIQNMTQSQLQRFLSGISIDSALAQTSGSTYYRPTNQGVQRMEQ